MNVDELLVRTLERHASEAPTPTNLADRARADLRHRRQRRAAGIALAAVLAVAAAVLGVLRLPTTPDPADELPPGWRWESYGGIQVQVPDSWGYDVTGSPHCMPHELGKPYVGRPGERRTTVCASVPPDGNRVEYLWFGSTAKIEAATSRGWAQEARVVFGQRIIVYSANADLRARILDSAQKVKNEDVYGCPPDHWFGPNLGPAIKRGEKVRSISVCTYRLGKLNPGVLIGSSMLSEADAHEAISEVLAATPEPEFRIGWGCVNYDEVSHPTLLRVRTASGVRLVRLNWTCGGTLVNGSEQLRVSETLARLVRRGPHLWLNGSDASRYGPR